MDIMSPHETSSTTETDVSPSAPQKRMWLEVAVIVLFVIAIVGIWRLVTNWHEPNPDMAAWYFYLDVGLLVVPLFLLALVMAYEAKITEAVRLDALYQPRFDRMEKILSDRESLLKTISDHQIGGISIFDRQNRYWFVNEQAAVYARKDPSEMLGAPPVRVLNNEKAKKFEIKLAQTRASDEPLEYVERINDESGATKFIQYHFERIKDTADMDGSVVMREDDLTSLFVERERRERMLRQVIDTLVAVVDRRDPYAAGHSLRVGQLSKAIATEMDTDDTLTEAAEIAGSLMNFGKVLVPRHILTKTTKLTQGELQRVRDSILTSSDILSIIGFEGPVVPTLRQVLERFDGAGEPEHLKGDDIILSARIVAVANAFVAFVSPRAHRAGLPFEEALAVMAHDSGKAFDERVLIALTNYIENRPNKLDWLKAGKKETPISDPR